MKKIKENKNNENSLNIVEMMRKKMRGILKRIIKKKKKISNLKKTYIAQKKKKMEIYMIARKKVIVGVKL